MGSGQKTLAIEQEELEDEQLCRAMAVRKANFLDYIEKWYDKEVSAWSKGKVILSVDSVGQFEPTETKDVIHIVKVL